MTRPEPLPLVCPTCGKVNDTHLTLDDTTPSPGDYSICWGCDHVAVYYLDAEGQLGLRKLVGVDLSIAISDPDVKRARAAMREVHFPTEAVRLLRQQPPVR